MSDLHERAAEMTGTREALDVHYRETQYGFEYGAAKVTRLTSDEQRGWVVIGIETPKRTLQVYVTKTGKMRLFHDGQELSS